MRSSLCPLLWLSLLLLGCAARADDPVIERLSLRAVGPCSVEISKLNYNQIGIDDGSLELIELRAHGAPEGATFGDCGVTRVSPLEGRNDACTAEPASRSIDVSSLLIPASGIALLGRGGVTKLSPPPDATTSLSSGPFLENGPDLLVLSGPDGPLLTLSVPAKGVYPTCKPEGLASPLVPVPEDKDGNTGEEHIIALCPEGYRLVLLKDQTLGAENNCPEPAQPMPDAGSGGESGDSESGSGGSGPGEPLGPAEKCMVRIDKLDVDQPDRAGAPRDTSEAVELFVTGGEGHTLGACGVHKLSPFNANTTGQGCGPSAGYYNEVDVSSIVVPPSGRVVIGNIPEATRPLATSASALQNGPDFIALRDAAGYIVSSVSYPAQSGGPWASCAAFMGAEILPADTSKSGSSKSNNVLVRCPGAGWALLPEIAARWGQAPDCAAVTPPDGVSDDESEEADEPTAPSGDLPDAPSEPPIDEQAPSISEGPSGDDSGLRCALSRGRSSGAGLLLLAAWLAGRARRAARRGRLRQDHFTATSSTSKSSVALGGMLGGCPCSP